VLDIVRPILSIMVINLILSGDNVVVVGMAARRLPEAQRRRAILYGAVGAIVLRIIFTVLAALLLNVPLIQGIGGFVLLWIAYGLLRQGAEEHNVTEGANLFEAVRTIIIADVIMSLDNILAVGGTAQGNIPLLIFGLVLSMVLITFGSNLVATLMNRLPWLAYVGAAILIYTAGEMIFGDPITGRLLPDQRWLELGTIAVLVAAIIGFAHWQNMQRRSGFGVGGFLAA
jgi:YjbE family integral membrane protein